MLFLSSTAQASLIAGLQAYYRFNDDGNDSSGNFRNLELYGGVGFDSGLFGQALDLHANASQYAQRSVDDSVFNFGTNDFTIQVWVNFNSVSGEQTLLEKFFGDAGPGWTLTKPGNGFQFFASGVPSLNTSSLSLTLGAWHHLIVRRDGSEFCMFFDGDSVSSGTSSNAITSTTNPLLVGRRNSGDWREFPVNGKLDEIAIWTRALSDDEIAALYNGGQGASLPIPEPQQCTLLLFALVAGWQLLSRARRKRA